MKTLYAIAVLALIACTGSTCSSLGTGIGSTLGQSLSKQQLEAAHQ